MFLILLLLGVELSITSLNITYSNLPNSSSYTTPRKKTEKNAKIAKKGVKMARKKYSAEFKVSVVLEVLKGEKSLNQIAQEHKVLPKNILNWKKQFLENAEIAMEPSKVVKEYKEQIKELEKKVDKYAKIVGKLTVERDWLEGKLEKRTYRLKED